MFVLVAAVRVRNIGIHVHKIMASEFQGAMQMESLEETAQGIRIVKAFTLEKFMRDRQGAAISGFQRWQTSSRAQAPARARSWRDSAVSPSPKIRCTRKNYRSPKAGSNFVTRSSVIARGSAFCIR
jgi:hypothetical protein